MHFFVFTTLHDISYGTDVQSSNMHQKHNY